MNNLSSPSNSRNTSIGSLFRFPLIRRVLVFCAVFHFILLLGYSLPKRLLRTDKNRDVLAYYLAIERIQRGEPLYLPLPEGPHKKFYLYVYPPVLSNILAMMPIMSFETFARIWTLFLYGAFWVYAVCLSQLAIGRLYMSGVLVAGLALTFFPGTHFALSQGQVDPFLWALFGIALTVPAFRGAGLMAISLVKPWAVWPFVWSLRDGWRVLIYALIVAAGSLLMGILVRGPETFCNECLTWVQDVLPVLGQGTWSVGNWSISFGVLRAIETLDLWDYNGGALPFWARSWLLFCGIAVPMLSGWRLRRQPIVLQLSVIGCVAVLFAPICWFSYLPLLLLPIAVLIGQKPAFYDNENNDWIE